MLAAMLAPGARHRRVEREDTAQEFGALRRRRARGVISAECNANGGNLVQRVDDVRRQRSVDEVVQRRPVPLASIPCDDANVRQTSRAPTLTTTPSALVVEHMRAIEPRAIGRLVDRVGALWRRRTTQQRATVNSANNNNDDDDDDRRQARNSAQLDADR